MDQKKIQEFQMMDQQSQAIIAQKQAVQIELNEVSSALDEMNKKPEEAYKILGNVMIKASPEDLAKDLEEKKKISDLRLSSLEKQEKAVEERTLELRKEISEAAEKEKEN